MHLKKHEYINNIILYVQQHEGCSLNDIRKNITNDKLSKSTICRILHENNITSKKICRKVVCKDPLLIEKEISEFKITNQNIDLKNVISIDESGFYIDDYKQIGYSTINKPITQIIKHKHNG